MPLVAASLLIATGGAAFGAPPAGRLPGVPKPKQAPAVKGVHALPTRFAKPPAKPEPYTPTRTTWPAEAADTIALKAPAAGAKLGPKVKAGRGTVWGQALAAPGPRSLDVKVLKHETAVAAGVAGVLLTVSADAAGDARIGVDYDKFAQAYGGNYAGQLSLARYPSCVLTTPAVPACRTATPLRSSNDMDVRAVSATVDVPAASSEKLVLAVAAAATAPEGGAPGGTTSATTLKPSGSWSGGGSSGAFTYAYPLAEATAPSDLTPDIGLAYNSAVSDGETSATQSQSSWAGEGWGTPESFIEQSFQSCSESPEGSAAPVKTYDRCYDGPIYHMSLNGVSTALVWDSTAKVFKSESADGSVVVHYCTLPSGKTTFSDPTCVSGGSNASGTYFNDWWKVIGRDGTAYSFGLNHLPGWVSGKAATNSVASSPVYSAHSGDPCYNATFSAAVCTMPYRWGLDYAVDTHANAVSYYYKQDTNFYGSYNGATMRSYVRDLYLDHVDYGFTDGNAYGTVPDKYVFGTGPRCVTGTCTPLTATTAPNWPDVPFAQVCASGATCTTRYPAFFSTVRLATVTLQQYSGSAYTTLDTYTLSHSMPQTGDGTAPTLWLDKIVHTASAYGANGGTGTAVTLPAVTFTATPQMANRLDTQTDGLPAYYKYRLGKITTETGSNITVSYYLPKPCSASAKPAVASNTSSCYPVSWVPDGYTAPITDWFNKYAVKQVSQDDPTGGASAKVTSYDYPDGPAWHYDTNELVKAKYRSYAQFRGYGDVITYQGDGVNDAKAKSETTYYRGMSKNNNSTAVNVTDSLGGTHEDVDELAGKELESTTYLGSTVDHSTITSYWVSGAAATRARTGLPALTSNWVAPVETYERQAVTGSGATTWRNQETDTSYVTSPTDPNFGLPVREYSHTSPAVAAYDTCTSKSYAPANTAKNLVGLIAEEEVLSVACGGYTANTNPSMPGSVNTLTAPASVSRPAQVVSATRTFYNDPTFSTTFPQAAPAKDDVTMVRDAADYTGGAYVWQTTSQAKFDSVGRQTDDIDGKGNDTRTAVTTNSLGLVTARTETNALGHATTTTLDTQRGLPLTITDPNGAVTTVRYDALGRSTSVWTDSRAIGTPANFLYSYAISNTGPTAVTIQKLNDELGYQTSTLIYDGLLRERQMQRGTPRDGRLVSDIFYDSRGWTTAKYNDWWDDDTTPGTATVSAADLKKQVPMQHLFTYDSLGRIVVDRSQNNGVEVARTTVAYNGDRTTVLPPAGGTATTTITDPLDRNVELDSYLTRPALTSPSNPFTTPFTVSGGTKQVVTYGFDNRGNQATTQQGAAGSGAPIWSSTYNLLGQVTAKADPDAGSTTNMQYDAAGNLTQSTDSRGKTVSYTYDALNRRTGTFAATVAAQQPADIAAGTTGNQLSKWVYDNANSVAGVTHALGQLTTSYSFAGTSTYASQQTDFDIFGNSLGTSVSIPASEGALGGTYVVKHSYTDTTGLLLKDIYTAKGGLPAEQVLHTYRSAFDLPDGLAGAAGYTQTTSYDALSRVNQTKFGPSTSTFTTVDSSYDAHTGKLTDQLVSATSAGTTTAVDEQKYRYDQAGNLTVQTNTRQGSATSSETQCFGYDGLDQLTAAWTAGDGCATAPSASNSSMVSDGLGANSAYWTTWQFDALGDRQNQVRHAFSGGPATDTTTTYGYGNASGGQPHTLTSTSTTGGATGSTSYGYDEAGSMTTRNAGQGAQTIAYDAAGQLTGVTGSTAGNAAYVYDADGTLLMQKDPATTVLYIGDQQFTLTNATGVVNGNRYYSLPGGGQVVRSGSVTTNFGYALGDQHGTPTLYLDSNGRSPGWRQYTPYGAPRGTAVTAPDNRGFLNKAMDGATGLTIVGARQYDPDTGRFITLDPMFEDEDPTQLNGYGYAGNNPVTHADPTGLMLPLDERPAAVPHTDARHASLVRYHHRSAPVRAESHHPLDRHEALRRRHPYLTPYDVDARHAGLIRRGAARHQYVRRQIVRRSTPGEDDETRDILVKSHKAPAKKDGDGKKVGGGMFEVCLSGIIGIGVSGVGSVCIAADRKGVGFVESAGSGFWFGGGAGGTVGAGISNGSIDDQAGGSAGVDVQGFAGGKIDGSVMRSTSSNVWTGNVNVGGGPGGGVFWAGGTHSWTQRWFDW